MIRHLKGIVYEISPLGMVLDVNGVGYQINIPLSVSSKIPEIGSLCELHIHSVYREDSASLYGFTEKKDRDFFNLLIEKVSGIGPRIGIGILSKMSVSIISEAIINEDVLLLAKCPGIGKKTAERIIIELKDKLDLSEHGINSLSSNLKNTNSTNHKDALSSLIALGFKNNEANKRVTSAIAKLGENALVEEIIKESLS